MNTEAQASQHGDLRSDSGGLEYRSLDAETAPSNSEIYTQLAERVYLMGKEASRNGQASEEASRLSMRILRQAGDLDASSSQNPNLAQAIQLSLLGAARLCADSDQHFDPKPEAVPFFDPGALNPQEKHALEDQLKKIFFTDTGENAIPGVSLRLVHPDQDRKNVWFPALAFYAEPTAARSSLPSHPAETPMPLDEPLARVQMDNLFNLTAQTPTEAPAHSDTSPGHLPNRAAADTAPQPVQAREPIPTRPEAQMIRNRTAELYIRMLDFRTWAHTDRDQVDPTVDAYSRLLYDRYSQVNESEPAHLFDPVPSQYRDERDPNSAQSAAAHVDHALNAQAFPFMQPPKTGRPPDHVLLYVGRADNPVSKLVSEEIRAVFKINPNTGQPVIGNSQNPENPNRTEVYAGKRSPTAMPGITLEVTTVTPGPESTDANGDPLPDQTTIWLVREPSQTDTRPQPIIATQDQAPTPYPEHHFAATADLPVVPSRPQRPDPHYAETTDAPILKAPPKHPSGEENPLASPPTTHRSAPKPGFRSRHHRGRHAG